MQIPSRTRPLLRTGMPWGGLLGVCIAISLSINIMSLSLHKQQFSRLHQLKKVAFGDTGVFALPSDPFIYFEGDTVRRLSHEPAVRDRGGNDVVEDCSHGKCANRRRIPPAIHASQVPAGTAASHSSSSNRGSASGSSSSTHGSMVNVNTGRVYCGGGGSSHGSGGSSGHGSAGGHVQTGPAPSDALLSLCNALVIGAAVMQLSARFPILQQTIVLFVIGFIISLVMKGLDVKDKLAIWGESYEMWMDIDPHLMLFTLLPALLAGDAMTIDTSVAKRVGCQCLYLAGPGVIFGGFATAFFLDAYIDWKTDKSFLLSLCAGSILCATDPVAVVALLKELGASPTLTVQIQGESLLNDGTAIVLYLISYAMLAGEEFDFFQIVTFLVEKALMAFALGLFIGYFFFGWIRAVANKLDHSAGMIQIVLTLCCAYWSFIFVEGILGLSGVLATVASSLVLAHHMWPYIVSEASMHQVWHTLESLGNTIIFFLAGSITGHIVVDIPPINWLHLIVIYIVLLTVRATMLFGSRPILQYLHSDNKPVSWQDATLMTWGGLRGAVGLALAIQVNNGRAPNADGVPQIDEQDAQRLLFFVSGIAFLTTLINATSAPYLVAKLGITALPEARERMLRKFHEQLVLWSSDKKYPPEIVAALKHTLDEAAEEIAAHVVRTGTAELHEFECSRSLKGEMDAGEVKRQSTLQLDDNKRMNFNPHPVGQTEDLHARFQDNTTLIRELEEVISEFKKIPHDGLSLLSEELPDNMLGKVDDMVTLIKDEFVDLGMAKVVNQCFLTLLHNNYWKLIEMDKLRPGSTESELLLSSCSDAMSPYRADLVDFHYVYDKILHVANAADLRKSNANAYDNAATAELETLAGDVPDNVSTSGCIASLNTSWQFNLVIALTILLNTIAVIISYLVRTDENSGNALWIVSDAFFTSVYVFEFIVKFAWLRWMYFKDIWNRFDFALVCTGIASLVVDIVEHHANGTGLNLNVLKLARVLRTMRFLRIFRLFNARLSADTFVSVDLQRHMKKINTLSCFVTAQIMAQNELLSYFGGNGALDESNEVEIARCILQSQVGTYRALMAAFTEQQLINPTILRELKILVDRKKITQHLSAFVEKAHADGAINATEAHIILHPLNDQISMCMKTLHERTEGVISQKIFSDMAETTAPPPATPTSPPGFTAPPPLPPPPPVVPFLTPAPISVSSGAVPHPYLSPAPPYPLSAPAATEETMPRASSTAASERVLQPMSPPPPPIQAMKELAEMSASTPGLPHPLGVASSPPPLPPSTSPTPAPPEQPPSSLPPPDASPMSKKPTLPPLLNAPTLAKVEETSQSQAIPRSGSRGVIINGPPSDPPTPPPSP